MKILRYSSYFIYCILLLCLVACHLKNEPKSPPTIPIPPTQLSPTKPVSQSLIWSGAVDFINPAKYRNFLRDYRKCDPCTHYFGPLQCKNFDSRADVQIQFEKNELPASVTLQIQPHYSSDSLPIYGYIGVCGFTVSPLAPIKLTGKARYFNDYQGFHVRFRGNVPGGGGNAAYLILRSDYSNPAENGVLSVSIYYGGSVNDYFELGTADLENPDMGDLYPGGTGGR